jgi:GNAT superfamily N-acetyltransferase
MTLPREPDERLVLTPEEFSRVHSADVAAYGGMFAAAAPAIGSGRAFVDGKHGAMAMWNPRDESSAYNTLIAFEHASHPDQAWEEARVAAKAGGATVFGVGLIEERYAWGTPERLAEHHLELEYEELVWAHRFGDGPIPLDESPARPTGIEIITDGLDREVIAQTMNRGWEVPPDHGRGPLYAAALGEPGWTHYLALIDGEPVAASALFCAGDVALFMVAATDPNFRGRGLQRAFIARRYADALAAGCTLGIAETVDDNASPRNFQRAGFRLVHRRLMYRTEAL